MERTFSARPRRFFRLMMSLTSPDISSPPKKSSSGTATATKIAIAICEDLGAHDPAFGRQLYGTRSGRRITATASPSSSSRSRRAPTFGASASIARSFTPKSRANSDARSFTSIRSARPTRSFLTERPSRVDATGSSSGRLPVFKTAFGVVECRRKRKRQLEEPAASEREDEAPVGDRDSASRAWSPGFASISSARGLRPRSWA